MGEGPAALDSELEEAGWEKVILLYCSFLTHILLTFISMLSIRSVLNLYLEVGDVFVTGNTYHRKLTLVSINQPTVKLVSLHGISLKLAIFKESLDVK